MTSSRPAAAVLLVAALAACAPSPSARDDTSDDTNGEGEGESPAPPPPPSSTCVAPAQARALPTHTIVVGDGAAASCTGAALRAAWDALVVSDANVDVGLSFACGDGRVTLDAGEELVVPGTRTGAIVVDGGGRVTLSGGSTHRVLRIDGSFEREAPRVTLQRIFVVAGHAAGDGSDPAQGGGAIQRVGGSLELVDVTVTDSEAPPSGQDVAGGAVMSIGGGDTVVVRGVFARNRASNGGALGNLGNGLVVVDSAFSSNEATGSGGNPGRGGNGGTISVDGEDRAVHLCGVRIDDSRAQAFGGAFFRVAYHGEDTTMEQLVVQRARIDDRDPSMGGALYVQGSAFVLRDSALLDNEARSAGGAYVGPGSNLDVLNVTFDGNTASSSLGGALVLDGVTAGRVAFATFVDNAAPGALAFAGAVAGDASRVTLVSSLFMNNHAGNGYNPITCTARFVDGAGSFQFPVVRAGNGGGDGGSDDPGALCAPAVRVQDVALQARDASAPVVVRRPVATSAAVGAGVECPSADASGRVRSTTCTSGAAEP